MNIFKLSLICTLFSFVFLGLNAQDPIFKKAENPVAETNGDQIWVGDYDKDNLPDIILFDDNTYDIIRYYPDGDMQVWNGGSAGFNINFFGVGDIDDDANTDIVVNAGDYLLFDYGDSQDQLYYGNTSSFSGISILDVSEDGNADHDVVFDLPVGDHFYIEYLENSDLSFSEDNIYAWQFGKLVDFHVSDLSGNNLLDVVTCLEDEGEYFFSQWARESAGIDLYYDDASFYEVAFEYPFGNFHEFDIEGDGDIDLAFASENQIFIIKNYQSQAGDDPRTFYIPDLMTEVSHSYFTIYDIESFDLDNDNDSDLFVVGEFGNFILRCMPQNSSSKPVYELIDISDQINESFKDVAFWDFDDDGYEDLIGAGSGIQYIYFDKTYAEEEITLDIDDASNGIKIYPNPGKVSFLKIEGENVYPLAIDIYDLNGKSIWAETIQTTPSIIQLPDCKEGIYKIHVEGENFAQTINWVKK